MKLFQIEEPEGGPADAELPGAAVGIDASGAEAVVAMAVGGNAVILLDREGFEEALRVPALTAGSEAWQRLLAGARRRAERALLRPVTHAVLALARTPDEATGERLRADADAAGLTVLRITGAAELGAEPALAAALLAEDLAPRADWR